MLRKLLALAVVLSLLCGCATVQTICDSKAEADQARAKALTVIDAAKVMLPVVAAELASANDTAIVAQLALALSALHGVVNVAYHLIYDVACPTLADARKLEEQFERARRLASFAVSRARMMKSM